MLEERFRQGYWDLAPRRIPMYLVRAGWLQVGGGVLLIGLTGVYLALLFGMLKTPVDLTAPLWVHALSVLFGWLTGGALLNSGLKGLAWRRKSARARRDGRPMWESDFGWQGTRIRDRAHVVPLRRVFWAVCALSLLLPVVWWGFYSERGHPAIWVVAVALAVATFVLASMALMTLPSYLARGRATLEFNRFPLHPGDLLSVSFSPNRYPNPRFTFRFVDVAGPNDENPIAGKVVRYSKRVQPANSALGNEVKVEFEIPDVARWTTHLSADDIRYWELKVDVVSSKEDYQTTFPLPVYAPEK